MLLDMTEQDEGANDVQEIGQPTRQNLQGPKVGRAERTGRNPVQIQRRPKTSKFDMSNVVSFPIEKIHRWPWERV